MAKAKKKTKKKAVTKKTAKKKTSKKKAAKKKTAKKAAKKKMAKKKAVKKKVAAKKKTSKKKATKKKAAKKKAKKKVVKKTTKKKAVKKKAAKKTTKKATAKKAASEVSSAKSPSTKKAVAKKTSSKKSAPKKAKSEEEIIMEEVKNYLSGGGAAKAEAKPKKVVDEEGVLNIKGSEDQVLDALAEEIWGNEVDEDEVVLSDAEGNPYCKAKDCDQLSVVDGYCRYHYILLWKRIQNRKRILAGGKLDRYIEELTARYPDKYLEMLRKDLVSEKDFLAIVAELDIDENLSDGDFDDDDTENYIQEMRGVTSSSKDDGDDY